MTTKPLNSTQLSADLLAAIQSRRTNKNMLAAAKALGVVKRDRLSLLSDIERNLTLDAIDRAHPGWRTYGATVARFHDVYAFEQEAA